MRALMFAALTLTSGAVLAMGTQPLANEELLKPVNTLFDAMRSHDEAALLAQFAPMAQLQRVTADGLIKTSDVQKFANSIATSQAYLDEQLLAVKVQQHGNLANVWTPFAFYLDNKLSHCGVNNFVLIKSEQGWKIQYLIDVTFEGDCQAFIAEH
ncbi:hypothetical protein [Bowmanella denitrificans]|uniref:hypothetical protein n=1 Tax=Bowmanella denitrificans TaxID=366582 RepID=UPI000C9CDA1C|nr:hypothetical protein [Bowmanella denitrificans]